MSEYTPGPWFVVGNQIYRRPKDDLYEFGGSVGGDKPICIVLQGWEEGGYPVDENAALIASAPAMKDEIATLTAQLEQLEAENKASLEEGRRIIRNLADAGVQKLTELSPDMGWDSGESVAEANMRGTRFALPPTNSEE